MVAFFATFFAVFAGAFVARADVAFFAVFAGAFVARADVAFFADFVVLEDFAARPPPLPAAGI